MTNTPDEWRHNWQMFNNIIVSIYWKLMAFNKSNTRGRKNYPFFLFPFSPFPSMFKWDINIMKWVPSLHIQPYHLLPFPGKRSSEGEILQNLGFTWLCRSPEDNLRGKGKPSTFVVCMTFTNLNKPDHRITSPI